MADNSAQVAGRKEFLRRMKDARIGDPVAQYEVALMYANGVGVSKSLEQAFAWTKTAAEKGHAQAQYLLARAYHRGHGTDSQPKEALVWYQLAAGKGNEKAALNLSRVFAEPQADIAFQYALEAAQSGSAEAQFSVAEAFAQGRGTARDEAQAAHWYLLAAQQGLPRAQYAMGQLLEHGRARQPDLQQACSWYRLAAAQGMAAAQLALERLDADGNGRSPDAAKAGRRAPARERRLADSRWVRFASQGGAEEFFHLGSMFERGVTVEKSQKQSRLWFQKAAELGHVEAAAALARSYHDTAPDIAAGWYLQAAKAGHAAARHALAQPALRHAAAGLEPIQQFYWSAMAASQGLPQAQFSLAETLHNEADTLRSELLLAAAHAGLPAAQFAVAERYAKGEGVDQDWFEACRWYQMAAEQGHAQAQCALGVCFLEGFGARRNSAKAFVWFEKAAAQDNPQAQWSLGEMYATGIPGVAQDIKQAAVLCKRAAQAGFAPAQATWGTLFARADKHEQAALWWERAAAQGDLEAQFNLATAFLKGQGVARDDARAWELLLSAAQAGLAAAQARLGLAYATGEGMVQDLIESAKWLMLAAGQGDKAARQNQARAKSLLSASQWAEASRRAGEWTRTSRIKP